MSLRHLSVSTFRASTSTFRGLSTTALRSAAGSTNTNTTPNASKSIDPDVPPKSKTPLAPPLVPTPGNVKDETGHGDIHPADVVAGRAQGPVTEWLDERSITAETVSDAPDALLHRQVRIYKPTKSTMQSAKGKTRRWVLDWDVLQGAGRWQNPLMGWAASGDYMQGTNIFFNSLEEAVGFAEKQGWQYQISPPKETKIPPKNYANNYVHVPGKLRIHHTK